MRLLGAGDNVVDRYRSLGRYFPGGNAVNVAVFAARLGARSAYLGVVGDDEPGRHILGSLRREGVDITGVRIAHGPTAHADIDLIGGDRVFLGSDRGVAMFTPDAEQLEVMVGYDAVHCGYASAMLDAVPVLARRTRVSFDFGHRWSVGSVVPHAAHLYLASLSAGHLEVAETVRAVEQVVAAGARHVLATRGAAGAFLGGPHGVTYAKAEPVAAVDTLGAGDAFIATVLVHLFAGDPPEAAMADAAHQAALVCTDYGAFGYPMPYSPDGAPAVAGTTSMKGPSS